MANPKSILRIAISRISPKEAAEGESTQHEAAESGIVELVERVFTTRNLVHFAHWNTKSFASHMALGELYEAIVDDVDDIVETYQGEFGIINGLETDCAKLDRDIVAIIQDDANWLKSNKKKIANGSDAIGNLLDNLTGTYNKILYKLKNLK